jgi:pimeloyl-ACP methyl ester carboxylesterase
MSRLGYGDHFVAQGGDWGSAVTSALGSQAPAGLKAIHINMVFAQPAPEDMADITPAEQAALGSLQNYMTKGNGYAQQQSTRPQTLGYGLADSPVGQAAWIYEKFQAWSDAGDDPDTAFGRDALLDNIMIYWLTNSGASSARLYWQSFGNFAATDVRVPTGMSIFPKEIFRASRRWAERIYTNIIHWNELPKGGHFAAFEVPELFVGEVRAAFRGVR